MAQKKQTKSEVVGVRFSPLEKRGGEALARRRQMSLSELLRELLREQMRGNGQKAVA